MNDTVCVATYDDCHGYWTTACGEAWWFDASLENGRVKFCPGCGKLIAVAEEKE